jgi:hypothetical protein
MTIFERELLLLSEARCVEMNIPIRRRFTHEELAPFIERVRQAARDVAKIVKEAHGKS